VRGKEVDAMTVHDEVQVLMQGTDYGDEALKARMSAELEERLTEASREGRPLRVYCGFDPRTADLHIGHTVPMWKLRQFQERGHEVTFVVGSGTAEIGDPSDKTRARTALDRDRVLENGRTYAEQAFRILDRQQTKVRYNHEWLDTLSVKDLVTLASRFSLQQFLTRENFRKRWDNDQPVWLHETFYSLFQGFDAYTLRADVQVGGTDQVFNIVTASRRVMSALGARPNVAVIVGILPGTDGIVKMSKSLGNHVPLGASAEEMFAMVMSIPDGAMPAWFGLASRLPAAEIQAALARHPRDAKALLARRIVALYRSPPEADRAAEDFERIHARRDFPVDMPTHVLTGPSTMTEVMVSAGLATSRSEARRLISQGGVRVEGRVVSDPGMEVKGPCVLQVGRRKFVRLVAKPGAATGSAPAPAQGPGASSTP
jgi:tyrosyl-tRNA synthetase